MSDYVVIDGINYRQSVIQAKTDMKEFVIRNFTPVFKDKNDRDTAKDRIGNELFRIFRKYAC